MLYLYPPYEIYRQVLDHQDHVSRHPFGMCYPIRGV